MVRFQTFNLPDSHDDSHTTKTKCTYDCRSHGAPQLLTKHLSTGKRHTVFVRTSEKVPKCSAKALSNGWPTLLQGMSSIARRSFFAACPPACSSSDGICCARAVVCQQNAKQSYALAEGACARAFLQHLQTGDGSGLGPAMQSPRVAM